MELKYKQADNRQELEQILRLQQRNLPENLSPEERKKEGFVTVRHDLDLLERMNEACGHIIAMDGGTLAGYALCMHPIFADNIDILKPMFEQIASHIPRGCRYMVMGQVCIDKAYRSRGIFRGLYEHMQQILHPEFEEIITEVDASNTRSVNAHRAIGFRELCSYTSGGHEWQVIQLATAVQGLETT